MEEDADEGDEAEEEVPNKVVGEDVVVTVRARVLQLDFSGRSDGRSMRMLLSHVAPRHLVLMHGSPQVLMRGPIPSRPVRLAGAHEAGTGGIAGMGQGMSSKVYWTAFQAVQHSLMLHICHAGYAGARRCLL
jgi:hypothetical protein